MTARRSRRDERVDEAPHLPLGGRRGRRLDLLDADRGAGAVLERELLELAQQTLLPVADGGDERLGAGAVQRHAQPGRLADDPARQLSRLHGGLDHDLAAGRLDGRRELRRRLGPALLAGEEGDGGVGRHRGQGRDEVRLDLRLLEALGAVDDEESPAHREGHRAQGERDLLRGRRVALEDLDAARAGLALGQRTQATAALGQAAVVVAVEQVGGLEGRHGPSLGAGVDADPCRRPAPRRPSPPGRSGGRRRPPRAGPPGWPARDGRTGCGPPPRRWPRAGAGAPGAPGGRGPPSRGG